MSAIGPVIFDLEGKELSAEEREILAHPLIGGVIFFTRNYDSPEQIKSLSQAIRKARKQPILITVDQEGGRVQRFRQGFLRIPSMGTIGQYYDVNPAEAMEFASLCGWLMAAEILAANIDLSFAPVLDIDKGISNVIGDRAFHQDPSVLLDLAKAFTRGMTEAGMAAVGKHFPGHGSVSVDSHSDLPVDERELDVIVQDDMVPFREMIKAGMQGIMAAHILFKKVDEAPVGFSPQWLKNVLRNKLNFTGMVFSDDLCMHGANVAGDFPHRVNLALEAGCDMVLVCNNRDNVIKTLDGLKPNYTVTFEKLQKLQGNFSSLTKDSPVWIKHYNRFVKIKDKHDRFGEI